MRMKGLVLTFAFALLLLFGTYALMVGAIKIPLRVPAPDRMDIASSSPIPLADPDKPISGNRLSRQAMEQVIDCYAGKPVYLDPEHSRPLYPSCEHLLRIYQSQTTDPASVLALLVNPDEPAKPH